jgi:CDP-4-dehydro-6-deoxyglucose reductase
MKSLQLEKFHYIPTLSREEWDGRTGYVHPIYEEICAKQTAGFISFVRMEGE